MLAQSAPSCLAAVKSSSGAICLLPLLEPVHKVDKPFLSFGLSWHQTKLCLVAVSISSAVISLASLELVHKQFLQNAPPVQPHADNLIPTRQHLPFSSFSSCEFSLPSTETEILTLCVRSSTSPGEGIYPLLPS